MSSTNDTPAEGRHSEIREIPVREGEHIRAEDLPAPLGLKDQLIRFVLVGGVSAVVDFGLLQLLIWLFGTPYPTAKAISFVFGTITAYSLNRRYTFRSEASWKKLVTTMTVYGIMFAVQWGLFTAVTAFLLDHDVAKWLATTIGFVIGQGVATITNFIVQRAFIFRG